MKFRKKYNKLFLFLFINIFLFSFISAGFGYDNNENIGTFQQNQCVELIQTCDNCTFNNISRVHYPNSTVILSNVAMTREDTYYNSTFCNTSVLGSYLVNGFGDLNGITTVWNYNFDITPSGAEQINQGEGLALFGIIIILVITIIFFLITAMYIQNKAFKVFLGSLSILMLIGTIGFGVTIMQQIFGTFTNLVSGYSTFFRLFMILLGGAGIGLVLFLVVFALKAFNKNRGFVE